MSLAAKHVHFEDCDLEIGVWVCVRGHDISTQLISGAAQHNTKGVCTLSAYLHSTFLTRWYIWFFQMAYSANQFGREFSSNCAYFQLCNCLPISLASNMLSGMQGWSRLDWWGWSVEDGSYLCVRITRSLPSNSFSWIFETHNSSYSYLDTIYLRCGVI